MKQNKNTVIILAVAAVALFTVFQYFPAHAGNISGKNPVKHSKQTSRKQKSKKNSWQSGYGFGGYKYGVNPGSITPYTPPSENDPGYQDMLKARRGMEGAGNTSKSPENPGYEIITPAATGCSAAIAFQPPVDFSLVTGILYPGQARGGNYKAHGGFRFDKSKNEDITVKIPLDASLIQASQYIEKDEVQYLVIFKNPCGIIYRFDHLNMLSQKLKAVFDTLPAPKVDDSRTTFINPPVSFTAGEVLATAVGFSKTKNVGVDFGVSDTRQPNEASKNPAWLQAHQEHELEKYGICWFDSFSANDAKLLWSLPAGGEEGKTSDFCK